MVTRKMLLVAWSLSGCLLWAGLDAEFSVARGETLTQDQVVAMVIASNLELQEARKALGRTNADLLRARAYPNPEFEVSLDSDVLTAGEGEGSLSLGLSQDIITGGKRHYQISAVKTHLAVVQWGVLNQERLITAETRNGFSDLLFLQEKIHLQEEAIQWAREWIEITEGRYRAGYVPEFDVNLSKIELQQRMLGHQNLLAERRAVQYRLNLLMGRSSEYVWEASGSLTSKGLEKDVTDLLSAAYQQRPDLKESESVLEEGRLQMALAKALRSSDLQVSIHYTYDRGVLDVNQQTVRDQDHLIGARLVVPIMISDKKEGEIAEAASNAAAGALHHEYLRSKIQNEVALAFQEVQQSETERSVLQKEILPLTAENMKMVEGAYRLGKAGILDVLEARQRFLESRASLLESEHRFSSALTELEKAIGR